MSSDEPLTLELTTMFVVDVETIQVLTPEPRETALHGGATANAFANVYVVLPVAVTLDQPATCNVPLAGLDGPETYVPCCSTYGVLVPEIVELDVIVDVAETVAAEIVAAEIDDEAEIDEAEIDELDTNG